MASLIKLSGDLNLTETVYLVVLCIISQTLVSVYQLLGTDL